MWLWALRLFPSSQGESTLRYGNHSRICAFSGNCKNIFKEIKYMKIVEVLKIYGNRRRINTWGLFIFVKIIDKIMIMEAFFFIPLIC